MTEPPGWEEALATGTPPTTAPALGRLAFLEQHSALVCAGRHTEAAALRTGDKSAPPRPAVALAAEHCAAARLLPAHPARALALLDASAALATAAGGPQAWLVAAQAYSTGASLARETGDTTGVTRRANDALAAAAQMNHRVADQLTAVTHAALGIDAVAAGDLPAARAHYRRARAAADTANRRLGGADARVETDLSMLEAYLLRADQGPVTATVGLQAVFDQVAGSNDPDDLVCAGDLAAVLANLYRDGLEFAAAETWMGEAQERFTRAGHPAQAHRARTELIQIRALAADTSALQPTGQRGAQGNDLVELRRLASDPGLSPGVRAHAAYTVAVLLLSPYIEPGPSQRFTRWDTRRLAREVRPLLDQAAALFGQAGMSDGMLRAHVARAALAQLRQDHAAAGDAFLQVRDSYRVRGEPGMAAYAAHLAAGALRGISPRRALDILIPAALALDAVRIRQPDARARAHWGARTREAWDLACRVAVEASDFQLLADLLETARAAAVPIPVGRDTVIPAPPPITLDLAAAVTSQNRQPASPGAGDMDVGATETLGVSSTATTLPLPGLVRMPDGHVALSDYLDAAQLYLGAPVRSADVVDLRISM